MLRSFCHHTMNEIKKLLHEEMVSPLLMCQGMASQLQVMSVVVNSRFKYNLWRLHNNWLVPGNRTFSDPYTKNKNAIRNRTP